MDYQLLLFLRIAMVVVLYLAILQIVFVARREMRQEARAVARGAVPNRARVVGHLAVLDKGSTKLRDGEIFDIEDFTTLGRDPASSVPMDSNFVSISHARIVFDASDSTLWVEDMDSRNGTYVDGQKVNGRVAVSPGSTLQIGDTRFKFMA